MSDQNKKATKSVAVFVMNWCICTYIIYIGIVSPLFPPALPLLYTIRVSIPFTRVPLHIEFFRHKKLKNIKTFSFYSSKLLRHLSALLAYALPYRVVLLALPSPEPITRDNSKKYPLHKHRIGL